MNLREIRKKKGMTQGELARRVSVNTQTICNYEKGIRKPNIDKAQDLARALDCTIDELVGNNAECGVRN